MKKFILCISLFMLMVTASGCTSIVVAKYDDYNETFTGVSNYDPSIRKALIELTSSRNKTKCLGHANAYYPPFWEFKVVCNDGRNIIGSIRDLSQEGTGFTNRNENVTFSVIKTQTLADEIYKRYIRNVSDKPDLDNTKKNFPANMGL